MFYSKNKKNVYPCAPQVYYIKVRCKRVYITQICYPDGRKRLNQRSIGLSIASISWLASSSLPEVFRTGTQWLQKVCISKNLGGGEGDRL